MAGRARGDRWFRRHVVAGVLAALVVAGLPGTATGTYQLDGRRGREIATVGGHDLVVVSGSPSGPDPSAARRLSETDVGLDPSDPGRYHPYVIASGDLDDDDFDDLVVTFSTGQRSDERRAIVVVPGGSSAAHRAPAYRLAAGDGLSRLGFTLLVRDLDRDGIDDVTTISEVERPGDLGVGTTREQVVTVYWGTRRGVSGDNATTFDAPTGTSFPALFLDAGNVVGDRRRELVVVSPGSEGDTSSGPPEEPGTIMLCTVDGGRDISCQEPIETPGGIDDIAVGDFVGGGRPDVVLGQSGKSEGEGFGGALHVYRSTSTGLAAPSTIDQSSPGVPGRDVEGDAFGRSFAVADIDRDGKDDLAVGAPGEHDDRGRVTVLYGHPSGFGSGPARAIHLDTPGVPGDARRLDNLGLDVSLVDVDGNRAADLVTAVPGKGHGAVLVVRSSPDGRLRPRLSVTLRPGDVGLPERAFATGLPFGHVVGR